MEVAPEEWPCGGPGCSGVGTKKCSRCGKEAYCSADCQRKAWPSHKLVCQQVNTEDNAIRELFKAGKLFSAREKLRSLQKPNAKLQAELEELMSLGMHSEILDGRLRREDVGELGQGYVATRDIAPEEILLFDTAFLTATVTDPKKAFHFLMAEKLAKRLAGGARRRSAKADAQAEFFFNHIKEGLPLKHGMLREAIAETTIEDDVKEQMLLCAIAEGCALYCTEEPEHMSLFPAACFFNHSCAPNARIESTRSTLIVRASEPIPAGKEVFISYLPLALLEEPGEQRRERLEDGRGFDCLCDRCRPELEACPKVQETDTPVVASQVLDPSSLPPIEVD